MKHNNMELVIWAGGRLRSVRALGDGRVRVEGWRRPARLARRERGPAGRPALALLPLTAGPLLLKRGPPLFKPARKPKQAPDKPAPRDACIQTDCEVPQFKPWLAPSKVFHNGKENVHTDLNRVEVVAEIHEQKQKPIQNSQNIVKQTEQKTKSDDKPRKETRQRESAPEVKEKETRESSRSSSEEPKELVIQDEDVCALREYIAKTGSSQDLYKFDSDPEWKTRVLFSWQPLVHVVRSAAVARLLARRFARTLGLKAVGTADERRSSSEEFQPLNRSQRSVKRIIERERQQKEAGKEIGKSEAKKEIGKSKTDTEGISGGSSTGNKVAQRERRRVPEFKRPKYNLSARSNASFYSALEDQAIVSWLSASRERERAVNGNRIWRELHDAFPRLTGQERSFHSLRNRYLRYILPGLVPLALPPEDMRRMRANAAIGEIKTQIRKRAVSESQPRLELVSASSRLRRPRVNSAQTPASPQRSTKRPNRSPERSSPLKRPRVSSERTRSPSKARKSRSRSSKSPSRRPRSLSKGRKSPIKGPKSPTKGPRSLSKGSASPDEVSDIPPSSPRPRTRSSYSELTKRFALRPRSTPQSPEQVRAPTSTAPTDTRKRRLFNP